MSTQREAFEAFLRLNDLMGEHVPEKAQTESAKADWQKVYEALNTRQAAQAQQGEDLRQAIFSGWSGCSNHDCVVTGPKTGMGTNGSCGCLMNTSRSQLNILKSRLQAAFSDHQPAQQVPEEVRAKALELCDAVENKEEFPPAKFALRCLMLIKQVRALLTTPDSEGK